MIVWLMVLFFSIVDGIFDVSVNLDVGYVENDVKGEDEVCLVNEEGD